MLYVQWRTRERLGGLSILVAILDINIPKITEVIAPTRTVDANVPIMIGCWQCLIRSLGLSTWTGGRVVVVVVTVVVVVPSNTQLDYIVETLLT